MSSVVEAFRYAFFGVGTLKLSYCLISLVVTALVALSGVMIFQKIERTVVDTV
jgi:lipopolysaccharide transport system permease protein